jgi:ketosteroid isomerase-like protein
MTPLADYADAWLQGDIERLVARYDPSVVLHYGGTSPFAGDHVGKERAIAVLAETAVRSARRLVAVELVLEDGDVGALFVREAIAVDDRIVEVARALRYRLRDDLIVECWLYDQEQHLVDRSWSERRAAAIEEGAS